MTSEGNKMTESGATSSSVTGKKNYRSGYNKKGAPTIRSAHENQFNELRGKILFVYGVQGQKEAFIKDKKAVAEFLGKTLDAGKELYTAMQTGVEPTFKEPDDPGANATPAQLRKYDILFKKNDAKQELYKRDQTKAFWIIVGQCSKTMRSKLEALPEIQEWEEKDNYLALLSKMRSLVYGTDQAQCVFWEMQAAMSGLFNLSQATTRGTTG
jgi:hypothetical protein